VRTSRVGSLLAIAVLAGCASPRPQFRQIGPDTFEINERSELLSVRANELKIRADLKALAVCADRNQALVALDSRLGDPDPPDYSYALVQFRCVPR
jgi:hypothetical protein